MISAIAGDVIGSRFEFNNISSEDFGPLFVDKCIYTDDTILTVATADVILNRERTVENYADEYYKYAENYPNRGWGGRFDAMVRTGKLEPYDSYGNGSAMRVSPVGWVVKNEQEALVEAEKSAACTHNHPEGIKGAQAITWAIWAARSGIESITMDKNIIKDGIERIFGYDLTKKSYDYRQGQFDVTCQGTIPRCMAVFLETEDFESAMRKTVAMGGDVDTNCCIVGSLCDAHYGLPPREVQDEVYMRLPKEMADIVTAFTKKYIDKNFKEPDVKISSKTGTLVDQLSSLFSTGGGAV